MHEEPVSEALRVRARNPHCGWVSLSRPKQGQFRCPPTSGLSGALSSVSDMPTNNAAEQAGVAIGTGIGVMMILAIWCLGAIVTGLSAFPTRPKD